MHKKIHTQQSCSVTTIIRNKKGHSIPNSAQSAYHVHAIQRGIEEHTSFEKAVTHFYSCEAQPLPFFVRIFPLLTLFLVLGVVALPFVFFL